MPPLHLYLYHGAKKTWYKAACDANGKLSVDPEVTEALEADLGDASEATLGSILGILGNPAQTFLAMIGYEGATSLAEKLTAVRAAYLDHSIADLITRAKGLDDIHDDVAALPTAKAFDTVRSAGTLAASASYTPPDNHLLTGIVVSNIGVLVQAKDQAGEWRDWLPYDTWATNKLFTLSLACDGVNVRIYNDHGLAQNYAAYLMRQV